MIKMLVLVGIQGSGKSTYAKEFIKNNPMYIRTNRDDIRSMIGQDYNKSTENLVFNIQLNLIEEAYKKGYNVVLDNTNFNPDVFKKIDLLNRKYNAEVEFKLFNTPLDECLLRNSNRENPVPNDVIINYHNKYIKNKTSDDIIQSIQSKTPLYQTVIPSKVLPNNRYKVNEFKNCIIVDIDGTIAEADNRNIYDLSRVHTDSPRTEIIKIIRGYIDYYDDINVLVVSGRDGKSLTETSEWLNTHFPFWNMLYMRGEGDNRCDSIVKEEIYLNHININYNVLAVFDDRKRVVDMWRKHKLNVLQVAEGDF